MWGSPEQALIGNGFEQGMQLPCSHQEAASIPESLNSSQAMTASNYILLNVSEFGRFEVRLGIVTCSTFICTVTQ